MPSIAAAHTTGTVHYVRPDPEGKELFHYIYDLPEGISKPTNIQHVESEVKITDLRSCADAFSLEQNGFQLLKLSVPENIDWDDQEQVKARYYPAVEQLLKQATGATRVHIFDNTIRRGHVREQPKDPSILPKPGRPVARVHVDYTATSGADRLNALLPADEADSLRRTPFAIVQVWRPLRGPVQDSPLGMIDASTVAKEDLLPYTLHFPGRTGYNYGVAPKPNHRWYYTKGMTTDEAYVFVCYDSRKGRARFTPHTGFIDHAAPADAPPRESIEIRSYCFFEDLEPQEYAKDL